MNFAERMSSPYLVMGMPPEDYHKALVGGLFYVGDDPEEEENNQPMNATDGNAPAGNGDNNNNAQQPAPPLPQWLIDQRAREQAAQNLANTIRGNAARYHGLSQNPDIKQALIENAHITRNRAYQAMNRPKVAPFQGKSPFPDLMRS